MSFKESYIDSNGWERIEVKNISPKERKEYLKKFTKGIRATLLAAMLSSNASYANHIDIRKYPHYAENFFTKIWKFIQKNVHVEKWWYNNFNYSNHYNTDYYDRYSPNVKNIENTNLSGIDHLDVRWWVLYSDWVKLSLVSAQNVIENEKRSWWSDYWNKLSTFQS